MIIQCINACGIFRLPLPADWCRHLHGYGVDLCVMTIAGVHVIAGTEEVLLASVDQESNKSGKRGGGHKYVVIVKQLLPEDNHEEEGGCQDYFSPLVSTSGTHVFLTRQGVWVLKSGL